MSVPGFNDKRVREWARYAVQCGWRVEQRRSSHVHWIPPEGMILYSGLTASAQGWKNFRSQLRRAGLNDGPLSSKCAKAAA